jgi:hypothetical protein
MARRSSGGSRPWRALAALAMIIVLFERLRDEVRGGKMLRPAVEHAWRRARRTILVSDTCLEARVVASTATPISPVAAQNDCVSLATIFGRTYPQ